MASAISKAELRAKKAWERANKAENRQEKIKQKYVYKRQLAENKWLTMKEKREREEYKKKHK